MIKRFFTNLRSDSATSEGSPTEMTSETSFEEQSKQQTLTKFNNFLAQLTKGKLKSTAEREEANYPEQQGLRLRANETAIAIAIGMLPVLALGTATYYFGTGAITEQTTQSRRVGTVGVQEAESIRQRQLQLLADLLVGTGATALLSGAIAAFLIDRCMRSATNTATALKEQEVARERVVRTKLFTDAVARIRASLNQEDILKAAVEETRQAIAADRVIVYSLDENSRGVVIAESVVPGWPRALPRALGSRVRDHYFEEVYLEKYQNGRLQVIDDIYEAKLTPCHLEILETYAVRANLVAPLLSEKKLIGLLIAHQCSSPRVWQQTEIALFTQVATQVGFALDNAKLLAERALLQEQLDIETRWKGYFTDTTQLIHASLNQEDVLKAAVEEGRRVLAADRVLVYSLDRKSHGVVMAESVAPGWPKALGVTIEDPCFAVRYIEKYENGRIQALNNIYEGGMTQCYIDTLETLAVKANLVTPILHEDKLLGLLIAHQCSSPRVWQPVEIEWFSQVAAQVGFALDNIKLIKQVEQKKQQAVAQEWHHKKAALRQQILALLRDSEVAFESFSTKAARQAQTVSAAVTQIEAIADAARGMAANAQTADVGLQQTNQEVQAERERVNRTVGSLAAAAEAIAKVSFQLKNLDETALKLSEFVNQIDALVTQMNRQAINATIESGRNKDAAVQSVVSIAEAVRCLTQQLTKTTAEIEPLVAQLEAQTEDLNAAMEAGAEQVVAGIDLNQKTRQKLNQLATTSAKLGELVSDLAQAANNQAETSTFARQLVLEVANLANNTSEQSTVVVECFTKLEALSQEL